MSGDRDGVGDARDGTGDAPQADDRENRPELDVETAFAALVAQFSAPTTSSAGAHPWPDSEDLGPDEPSAGDAGAGTGPGRAPVSRGGGASAGTSGETPRRRSADDAAAPNGQDGRDGVGRGDGTPTYASAFDTGPAYPRELDEHYVPPEPPPLPRGDTVSRLAWAGVIGGPLFLLIAAMLSADLPAPLLLAALAAFIGGFVTLVARMPGEPPEDGGDGAVV